MRTILAIIMLLGSVGLFIIYIIPTFNDTKEIQVKNEGYEKIVENAKILEEKRDELILKQESFTQSQLNRLEQLLPSQPDTVKLILELDQLAKNQGVLLQNVRIEQVQEEASRNSRNTTTNTDIGKFILNFTVTGTYPGYVLFLESIEKNLRIMNVQKTSFVAPNDRANYQFQTSVETYWVK